MYNIPVRQQALPGQALDSLGHGQQLTPCAGRGVGGGSIGATHGRIEDLGAPRGEGLALGDKVVLDQAEGAFGHDIGADVEVAGVAGAEGERLVGEAVVGHMAVGGRQDLTFGGIEGARRGRVVVGVVAATIAPATKAGGR